MPPAVLRELGDRWRAIHASKAAGQAATRSNPLLGQPATLPSAQRDKAIVAFVDRLQACRPDLYSERALRSRSFNRGSQTIVSLALGAILARWTSSDIQIIGDLALVLFVIASWSLVTTIQLWRTYRLVKRIGQVRTSRAPVTPQSLARPEDAELQDL